MVNKNYILLAGLVSALAVSPAMAQESSSATWSGRDMTYRGQSYDALDSAYIPASRMEQQREYLDHKYAFPAAPRSQFELGLSAGLSNVLGDVTSKTPFTAGKPLNAIGFGASIRKATSYVTSIRLQYNFQQASGFDYRGRTASLEAPWNSASYTGAAGGYVYSNYKLQAHELTLQFVAALNNIKFHKAKNVLSVYGFAGAGVMAHRTLIATGVDNSKLAAAANNKDRNDIYKDYLKDAEYDYSVVSEDKPGAFSRKRIFDEKFYVDPVLVGGVGIQFKLGSRVSLQFENKVTYSGLDGLDGVTLDPNPGGGLSPDKDLMNYASVGLGFNLGAASRTVAPLWWVNPLDHVYNELADPRHMTLPAVILPDTDGDGVTDQFDKCPDTPLGVAVDAHGCPLDTDGDGVPDFRDKQLITPTECQPVDADGVGNCPCPEGCATMAPAASCSQSIMGGSVSFSSNSARLSAGAQSQLAGLAAQMNADPTCNVVVMGNAGNSKLQQQRSWDRVNAVISYMSDNMQISRSRFIFRYDGNTGDANSVMFRSAMAGETGSGTVAPPHPQLGTNR